MIQYRFISSDYSEDRVHIPEMTIQYRGNDLMDWEYICTVKRGKVEKRSIDSVNTECEQIIKAFQLRDAIKATARQQKEERHVRPSIPRLQLD